MTRDEKQSYSRRILENLKLYPAIQQGRNETYSIKIPLGNDYRITYYARESWSDPGICTVTYSYCAYKKRRFGWKRIFEGVQSRWGALSVRFDGDNIYRWKEKHKPDLDRILELLAKDT